MPNTTIHGGAKVEYSIIGECADIGKDAVIGKEPTVLYQFGRMGY